MGLGLWAPAVARQLAVGGWDGPRVMNAADLRGYHGDFAAIIDGRTYVDMHADGDRILRALRERFAIPPERAQPQKGMTWAAC